MNRRNDKRSRLIQAADELFHKQGVNITTLANIATLADVPLGNVYYYFKSKDSITLAVIEYRRKQIIQKFETLNQEQDTRQRIISLIETQAKESEKMASFGDSLGSLCQELGKQGGEIATAAASLMNEILAWSEKQFIELGKGELAKNLALNLVAGLQGMSLLTLTFRDPNYVTRQANNLINWVRSI